MRGLLDILLPPRCPGCRDFVGEALAFCRPCLDTFTEVGPEHCDTCGEPGGVGRCAGCRDDPPAFEKAAIPFLYGGALADAVHRLKYEGRRHCAQALARVALPHLAHELAWCELVAPVPLHLVRLRARGYDQALLIARALARPSGRAVGPRAVRRVRDTPPQVGRDRGARRANVAGAFEADPAQVGGRRLLLVDDVVTTGATASEAARAALAAGASAVRVAALARAP